ncbi:aminoglycoside phosphotransferase (APT) family kinase protein [Marisediminicola sp. UYEF4]|uniref:phosphotransferase n=1 Tax=Marisediminicola sp. UYEF4 TaxID=1756384 RepID=UPI003391622B
MARSPLTLAALATSAVAGLDVTTASRHGSGSGGDYEQAALSTRDGQRLLIRVPRSPSAETQASADLIALRALSTGIRARLPFSAPTPLGHAPVGGTRAVVCDLLPGSPVGLEHVADADLAESIGRAVAAIHALPTSFVADAGLSIVRPLDALAAAVTIMDQAVATGLVPAALVVRWENATEDPTLWQFAPTVIHGAITGGTLLTDGQRITGVVEWHALGVGDPARDLFWLLGAPSGDGADALLDAYSAARGSTDRQLRKRAMLYAELEIAQWLLHGTTQRSTEIVDDAVGMLHNLVDVVQHDINRRIDTNTSPVMTVTEVEDMLDRNGRN